MESRDIFIIYLLLILAMVCSCGKKVQSELIYGYWVCIDSDVNQNTPNPIGLKLDFHDSLHAWIDPVVSDTIYYFSLCKLHKDTLLLQDGDTTYKYHIKKLSDYFLEISFGKKVIHIDSRHRIESILLI